MQPLIRYTSETAGINWERLKATLAEDRFDNGRSAEQLRASFENSHIVVFAITGGEVIGTARALSDGVCNAYVVDVWTLSRFRRQGIATQMMQRLLSRLAGQHVYLFTDDVAGFYQSLGFKRQPDGLGMVVGRWLDSQQQG